jgi:hypothetical protein
MSNKFNTFIKNAFLNPGHYFTFHRVFHYLKTAFFAKFADTINKISKSKITGSDKITVSLTSHSHRIAQVHRTIESIGRGTTKPSRIILWLGHEEKSNPLPESLQRLRKRGLEINYADNYGPHTKYYPYVTSITHHTDPMVNADDDMWYPKFWLERLWTSYQASPEHVHCHKAIVVQVKNGVLLPYSNDSKKQDTEPDYSSMPQGVCGVIYPPLVLNLIRDHGNGFLECCPKQDDIWLHAVRIRSGIKAKQIAPKAIDFMTMPLTQSIALYHHNLFENKNDHYGKSTYSQEDLNKIEMNK